MPHTPYAFESANAGDPVSIEGLFVKQVRTMASLLEAATPEERTLRVATVCSGTESPLLALQMFQEIAQASLGVAIRVQHVHSCEIVPFKSSYIARNFPGIPVFADVVEVALAAKAGGTARTALGAELTVPDADLLVAGTSCKDFSHLKSTPLTETGSSGNTFFATVDLMHTKQYKFVILENVLHAEWASMEAYITGRFPLALMDDFQKKNKKKTDNDGEGEVNAEDAAPKGGAKRSASKAKLDLNKSASNKKSSSTKPPNDVLFERADDKLVVSSTPSWAGVRAGGVLEGYTTGGAGRFANARTTAVRADSVELDAREQITLTELADALGLDAQTTHLVFRTPVAYNTKVVKVDTKDFGLPQTRQRRYMLVWRADVVADEEAGERFGELVESLKAPPAHAYDAFLLPDTDPAVRRFRETLRGPSGRRDALLRQRGDWWASKSLDAARHKDFRSTSSSVSVHVRLAHKMEELSRPCTMWAADGRFQLASGKWLPEYVSLLLHRELDLLECAMARNAQSNRDFLFHATSIDTSQNVTRTTLKPSVSGIVGCLTPGGNIFLSHKGRPVLGREKLLLSGIPTDRLLLGPESEVELSDLAGNAMSCPVVGVCLISLMCLGASLRGGGVPEAAPADAPERRINATAESTAAAVAEARALLSTLNSHAGGLAVLHALRETAFETSVLCTCESSGGFARGVAIQGCADCGLSVCAQCAPRVQLETHTLSTLFAAGAREHSPHAFELQLWQVAPKTLIFFLTNFRDGTPVEEVVESAEEALVVDLTAITRDQKRWNLAYAPRDAFRGARLSLDLGKGGVVGSLTFPSGARFELDPSTQVWHPYDSQPSHDLTLQGVVGEEAAPPPTKSYVVECGLHDDAQANVCAAWPGAIRVATRHADHEAIQGTYVRKSCRHTTPFGVLYVHEAAPVTLTVGIQPYDDSANRLLFTHTETQSTWDVTSKEAIELLDTLAQPGVEVEVSARGTFVRSRDTTAAVEMHAASPASTAIASMDQLECHITHVCTSNLFTDDGSPTTSLQLRAAKSHDLSPKILQALVAPMNALSAHMADQWVDAGAPPVGVAWGADVESTCPAPPETWVVKATTAAATTTSSSSSHKGRPQRVVDPELAAAHERSLSLRPRPWRLEATLGADEDVCVRARPEIVMHQAAFRMNVAANPNPIHTRWRLMPNQSGHIESLHTLNAAGFSVGIGAEPVEVSPTAVELPSTFRASLYPRQARAVQWMVAVERGEIHVQEVETVSDTFHASIPWTVQGLAARSTPLRGGCLCDSMGSGKTVVGIALLAAERAQQQSTKPEAQSITRGALRSSATLIVAPRLAVKLVWAQQIKQFASELFPRVVAVESAADLLKCSARRLVEADVVIVAQELLTAADEKKGKDNAYLEMMFKFTNLKLDAPSLLTGQNRVRRVGYVGDSVMGTCVPFVAQAPYGNAEARQGDRESAAYFTHCYHTLCETARRRASASDFSLATGGVPIEAFAWRRILVDEVHIVLGADATADKTQLGIRELLGVGVDDPKRRPLQTEGCVWGLSGTPMFTAERTVEFAALCSRTHVAGAKEHSRVLERASARQATLHAMRSVPEPCDLVERHKAVQSYLDAGARCYQAYQSDLEGVELKTETLQAPLDAASSTYLARVRTRFQNGDTLDVANLDVDVLQDLLEAVGTEGARREAFHSLLKTVEARRVATKEKLVVVAPAYAYAAARQALEAASAPFVDAVQQSTDAVAAFVDPSVCDDWVLLLDETQLTGLNLQYVSRHIVFFAPIYHTNPTEAAALERQAIARVYRHGQTAGTVFVSHILFAHAASDAPAAAAAAPPVLLDVALHASNNEEAAVRAATVV